MKVCITSYGPTLGSRPQSVFGRCEFFVFVDPATLEFVADPNPNAANSDFSGIMSAQYIISKGATVLITDQVGDKARAILAAANVEIVSSVKGTVREALEPFRSHLQS